LSAYFTLFRDGHISCQCVGRYIVTVLKTTVQAIILHHVPEKNPLKFSSLLNNLLMFAMSVTVTPTFKGIC